MFRNNFIFTFSNYENESDVGIYKRKRSREVIPCEEIKIASPKSKLIVRNLLDWLKSYKKDDIYDFDSQEGYLHNISIRNNNNNEFMLEIYLHNNDGIDMFIKKIKEFDFANLNIVSVYIQIYKHHHNFRGEFTKIYGSDYLDYHFKKRTISIYPGAFFQTNNDILFEMYNNILDIMNKESNIFMDLYCGVGVMSILSSDFYEKCYGIEINSNSIDMANYNMKKNKLNNIEFICSPVEDIISNLVSNISEKITIFINPPRSGLRKNVINELNKIKKYVNQIVYLSCSEKTLERDLKLFNYSSKIIKKYNMFLDTGHIETLCELR